MCAGARRRAEQADGDSWSGSKRMARAVSELFNDRFAPIVPVTPEQLIFGCGVSAVVDQLTSLLCEPGEALLTAKPFYNVSSATQLF